MSLEAPLIQNTPNDLFMRNQLVPNNDGTNSEESYVKLAGLLQNITQALFDVKATKSNSSDDGSANNDIISGNEVEEDNITQGILRSFIQYNELTIEVSSKELLPIIARLKTHKLTLFSQCVDLCAVDYLGYGQTDRYVNTHQSTAIPTRFPSRFAVVYHLLSMTHNRRLRVRVFVEDDKLPIIPSLVDVYNGVNWFEREAFDLFGIVFDGHPDLRRILTDYGFIGHPLRKDFPLSGHSEVRYDKKQKRVVYQPVTIEPREVTMRVIRNDYDK